MKFSILMANFNAATFIKDAVESVLRQTYASWELIFVDDASTDNSLKQIEKFRSVFGIKIIRRETNGGYGLTLRTAIEHATGDIIAILDSDDMLDKEALQVMVDHHQKNPKCALIYSQFMSCNAKLKSVRIGDCGPIPKGKTWLDILTKKIVVKPKIRISHFKTFKRSAYNKTKGFHKLRRTVDKDIVLKLEEIARPLFIDRILYYYRVHPKGISRNRSTHPFGKIIVQRAIERRSKNEVS